MLIAWTQVAWDLFHKTKVCVVLCVSLLRGCTKFKDPVQVSTQSHIDMGFWQTIIHASTYAFTLHVHTVQRHSAWYYIGIIHGCQSWCNPLDVVTGWQVWETKSLFWSDPLWRRDWPIVYPHLPYSPCTSWPTLATPWKGRNSSIVYKIYFLYFQPNINFLSLFHVDAANWGQRMRPRVTHFFVVFLLKWKEMFT